MSSQVIWHAIRNHNSFMHKRDGARFTTEPNNLTARSSYKASGLANEQTIGLHAISKKRGCRLTLKRSGGNRRPRSAMATADHKGGLKRIVKSIKKTCSTYRSDLTKVAVQRAGLIYRSQHQKAKKEKKTRRSRN
eukprot:Rmarinus@m.9599